MINPVILFIPVSSVRGIGEYSRSLIIAETIKQDIPSAQIHFILNKHAKYSRNCPFQVHYSDHSATKDTPKVISTINEVKPNLVIFDCAGRARQYAAAKSAGAKVIFISQHRRKRARGMTLRRSINIDKHWVVQPAFAIKPLTPIEKFKLRLLNKSQPENIGPILPLLQTSDTKALLGRYGLIKNNYFVFSAGSGGHELEGKLVSDMFYEVAKKFQQQTNMKSIVVFGQNYPKDIPQEEAVVCIKSLPSADFVMLISEAKGRVLSAGDTLLQAIALQKPSVGVAISKDQPLRLEKCLKRGLATTSDVNVDAILYESIALLDEKVRNPIIHNLNKEQIGQGLAIAIREIKEFLTTKPLSDVFSKKKAASSVVRQKKYLFFVSQDYSFPILRPLQKEIQKRGDLVKWFLYGSDINRRNLTSSELSINQIKDVIKFSPDAVFVPGNVVPSFISGLKVQVFHGLPSSKIKKDGKLYHYIIRGMFDLYCTQGPSSTTKFKALKEQYGFFQVAETGWCKLDPLFHTSDEKKNFKKSIFFASTFSPRFSRARILYPVILDMMKKHDIHWYVTLHPKMAPSTIKLFKSINLPNVQFIDSTNLAIAFKNSSLMLCDTSSIIYEFLTLRKPVVTFQTETDEPYLINVEKIERLEETLLTVLNNLEVNKKEIENNVSEFHPYSDGISSQRTIDVVEDMLSGNNLPIKKKPTNIIRNFKLRRELNYWTF